MRNESLKERILVYLSGTDKWINGGEIERLAMNVGYKSSNASRRCRELVNEGKILKAIRRSPVSGVASVWYHRLP